MINYYLILKEVIDKCFPLPSDLKPFIKASENGAISYPFINHPVHYISFWISNTLHRNMINSIILMGVSGSGKTTIGHALSEELGWSFFDGDDYHPPENIAKMSQGIPLDDRDRQKWLESLSTLLSIQKASGEASVLACSALKRNYQEQLRGNRKDLKFVYLAGDFDLILERMQARRKHFMRAQMLASQFEILEPPPDALVINTDQPVATIVQEILKALEFDLDPH